MSSVTSIFFGINAPPRSIIARFTAILRIAPGGFETALVRYTNKLILTLTINPALDRNVTVDRLAFEDRGYILSRGESPGGRGINASRVIHSFGGKTLAIVTVGGENGAIFEKLTDSIGFPLQMFRIQGETR